jgi:hypothetical protein
MKSLGIALGSIRRESQKGFGHALEWFTRRFYLRMVRRRFPLLPPATKADRERKLTVIIPAAEKDAAVLGHCVSAARQMIQHQLSAVWVVGPESSRIRQITSAAGGEFVHEDLILPRPAAELKCRGWVLQQLIKFNAAFHVPTDDYLVLDSDTVFLCPQSFLRDGKTVLRYSDQYELLYNRSLDLIFKGRHRFPVSFVTHHMLLNRGVVKDLLGVFGARFNRLWWEAILYELDQGHPISFSEFELYGNYVVSQMHWRRRFVLEYWGGLDCDTRDLSRLTEIMQQNGQRHNSVSFHIHTQ